MKSEVCLSAVTRWSLAALVFFLPVFFLPITSHAFETPKQVLLVLFTATALSSQLLSTLQQKRIITLSDWWNFLPFLLFVSTVASARLGLGGVMSWLGGDPSAYTSVATAACVVALFYVFLPLSRDQQMRLLMRRALLASASIAGLFGTLSIVGLLNFLHLSNGWNSVGTLTALGIFLAVVTWVTQAGLAWKKLMGIDRILAHSTALFALVIALGVDDVWLWLLHLVGSVCVFLMVAYTSERTKPVMFTPLLVVVLSCLFMFAPVPLRLQVPVSVSPSYAASWSVTQSTLQSSSTALFLGSGPSTFIYDYTKFRPASVNKTLFWSAKFDRARSYFLTTLAENGIVGLALMMVFFLTLLVSIFRALRARGAELMEESSGMFIGWFLLVLVHVLFASNLTLLVLLWLFSAGVAGAITKNSATESKPLRAGAQLIVSFIAVLLFVMMGITVYGTLKSYVGKVVYNQAIVLSQTSGDTDVIVETIKKSISLSPENDTFYRNLASLLLARAKQTLVIAGITDEQKKSANNDVANAVAGAKRATELSPNNVDNWIVRGNMYRELITLATSAEDFSAAALQRAVDLEPGNPTRYVDLGRVYLAVADYAESLTNSTDSAIAQKASASQTEQLANAEQNFSKAITMKADYAPAYYYLAATLERQNRLPEAIARMIPIVASQPNDTGLLFQLAMLYLRAGDDVHAGVLLSRILTLAPTNANALWYAAALDQKAGRVSEAIAKVQQVADQNPTNQVVAERLRLLIAGQTPTEIIPEPVEDSGTSIQP